MKKNSFTKFLIFAFITSLAVLGIFFGSNFKNNLRSYLGDYSGSKSLAPVKADFSSLNGAAIEDFYTSRVQKVFNNRCVACHGCYEAPCQLSLQSYEGLKRGVHADLVYDDRIKAATPTRLDFDADNMATWKKLEFKDVIGDKNVSVLLNSVKLAAARTLIQNNYPAQRQCLNQNTPNLATHMQNANLAMPYNMAPLDEQSVADIQSWIKDGAPEPPEPSLVETDAAFATQVAEWNDFLNKDDFKHQLTSRYLYEHLYLAHLYFPEKPRQFYRMIRSSSSCDNPKMISTRLANDNPGIKPFYYCIVKYNQTIVSKSHLPYQIGTNKLNRIKQLFIDTKWTIENGALPSYDKSVASNPFIAFKDMPQDSRYRFLLDDAHYNVMTFIKGPVCNGSGALNSIQDRFFVFFMAPESDLRFNTQKTLTENVLPGQDITASTSLMVADLAKATGKVYSELITKRKSARSLLNAVFEKEAKNGLTLNDIWDGDGHNTNAVLTIMRHDNNAAVFKGAVGDITKTAFVLDYSTFERLVYNLVVNFDVFGNVGHQLLSRIYMDIIRMDAEDAYLNFLPEYSRIKLKSEWYSDRVSSDTMADAASNISFLGQNLSKNSAQLVGASITHVMNGISSTFTSATQIQQKYLYGEGNFPKIKHGIPFTSNTDKDVHLELIQKILFDRLGSNIVKKMDSINWSKITENAKVNNPPNLPKPSMVERQLSRLTTHMPQPYARYFSELSFLMIGNPDPSNSKNPILFYSMAHNRELNSIAWIFAEKLRQLPEEDSLTISSTVLGSHPNQFFYVDSTKLNEFIDSILKIKSKDEYAAFLNKYGVSRMNPDIWKLYDFANANYLRNELVDAGYLDLFRYNY